MCSGDTQKEVIYFEIAVSQDVPQRSRRLKKEHQPSPVSPTRGTRSSLPAGIYLSTLQAPVKPPPQKGSHLLQSHSSLHLWPTTFSSISHPTCLSYNLTLAFPSLSRVHVSPFKCGQIFVTASTYTV